MALYVFTSLDTDGNDDALGFHADTDQEAITQLAAYRHSQNPKQYSNDPADYADDIERGNILMLEPKMVS